MTFTKHMKRSFTNAHHINRFLSTIKHPSCNLEKSFTSLFKPMLENIFLKLEIVMISLRKYVNKIQNILWPVLMFNLFSTYSWRILVKPIVTLEAFKSWSLYLCSNYFLFDGTADMAQLEGLDGFGVHGNKIFLAKDFNKNRRKWRKK